MKGVRFDEPASQLGLFLQGQQIDFLVASGLPISFDYVGEQNQRLQLQRTVPT